MVNFVRTSIALTAAVILFTAAPAQADSITFSLTSDHCTGGCLTGQTSAGTVAVNDNGGANTLSFAVSLLNNNEFVSTGLEATFGFNLTGNPTITYSGLPANWLPDGPTAPSLTEAADSLHMSATGFFDYGVEWGTQGGGHGTPGPLTFIITAPGLTLASLEQNAAGNFFAVDILSGTTGNTGAVDAADETHVPDGGSTLTLLGFVLLGVGILRRNLR